MVSVSVIIPNYNHAPFLRKRIDSVLNQSFRDFEVILLDDASADSSRAILEEYGNHPKVRQLIYNKKNSGNTFSQWKKGIALARGKYIWIAESDDMADLNLLEAAHDAFSEREDVGLVYFHTLAINTDGVVTESHHRFFFENIQQENHAFLNGKSFMLQKMIYQNIIYNASAVVFKKELIREAYLLEEYKYVGDFYLWQHILMQSNIHISFKANNYFRIHTASTTKKNNRKNTAAIQEFYSVNRHQYHSGVWSSGEKKIYLEKMRHLSYKWIELKLSQPFGLNQIDRKTFLESIKFKWYSPLLLIYYYLFYFMFKNHKNNS